MRPAAIYIAWSPHNFLLDDLLSPKRSPVGPLAGLLSFVVAQAANIAVSLILLIIPGQLSQAKKERLFKPLSEDVIQIGGGTR